VSQVCGHDIHLTCPFGATVDPVVMAVITVGRVQAGTEGNAIPGQAVMDVKLRSYTDATRAVVPDAIRRIITAAFSAHFGHNGVDLPLQTPSEDLNCIPMRLNVPFTYWAFGGTDAPTYAAAPT
jgi:hippurate hydrolase